MTDDRFKDAGEFHPDRAWDKIQEENSTRARDAKYPKRWWHDTVFSLAGLAVLLMLAVSVVLILLALFGIL